MGRHSVLTGAKVRSLVNVAQGIAFQQFPRHYLGMSQLGRACKREIWFNWRWANPQVFSPRMYRLFNRGHREEPAVVKALRLAGMTVFDVDPNTNRQYEFVSSNGHCMGHCDGLVEFNGIRYLLEIKTHNNNNYQQVAKTNNIRISKIEHYWQAQRYTGEMGLEYCLYCAVNKNDDSVHWEVHALDNKAVESSRDRERDVLSSTTAPLAIGTNPDAYPCRNCWYRDICFYKHRPVRNCRTCRFGQLEKEGKWKCFKLKRTLTLSEQWTGCQRHQFLQDL